MRRASGLLLGFALGLSACGGEDQGRPSAERTETEPIEWCEATEDYEFLTITDFEPAGPLGCNPEIPCYQYYLNFDDSLTLGFEYALPGSDREPECPVAVNGVVNQRGGCVIDEQGQADMGCQLDSEALPDNRCGQSGAGFHILGTNVATCFRPETGRRGWGISWELQFGVDDGDPVFDASDWDGVSFWVKRGTGPSGSGGILSVGDWYSDPDYRYEDPETGEEVHCDGSDPASTVVPVPDSEKCDAFGIAFPVTENWVFVAAPFEALRQKGFGKPSPLGRLDTENLRKLQFLLKAGDWDLWIDDIAFFRAPD